MGIIACDLGNTTLKCAVLEREDSGWMLKDFWKGEPGRTAELTAARAISLGLGIVLMSVRPDGTGERLVNALNDRGIDAMLLTMDHAMHVPMEVDRSTVGLDRVCNVVAATERLEPGHGVIVVDAGTAVTLEVVAPDGTFVGGAIAPGPDTAMDGLFQKAPRLASFRPKAPTVSHIGRTTAEALGVGKFVGCAGSIEAMVKAVKDEIEFPVHVIGTGGAMVQLLDFVPSIDTYVPHLTLEGVAILATRAIGND